jgi:hypothetical protein
LGDGAQSVTAAIFWLKTRAGWKETVVQETEVRYVARLPEPMATVDEWLRLYAPKTIEHDPVSGGRPPPIKNNGFN